MRRSAAIVSLLLLAAGCGGGGGSASDAVEGFSGDIEGSVGDKFVVEVSEAALAKLPELNRVSSELPSTIDTSGVVVMLIMNVDKGGQVLITDPPKPLAASSLRLGRAITKRRTEEPRAWAMLTESGGDVIRYWVPLDPSALVRATITNDDGVEGHDIHSPYLERVETMYSAMRIPFFPRAKLEIVRTDGTGAGAYRFGERPGDKLERLR